MNVNTSIGSSFLSPTGVLRQTRMEKVGQLLEEQKTQSRGLDAGALAAYRGYAADLSSDIDETLGLGPDVPSQGGRASLTASEPVAPGASEDQNDLDGFEQMMREQQRVTSENNRRQQERIYQAVETVYKNWDELDRVAAPKKIVTFDDLYVALRTTRNQELRDALQVLLSNPQTMIHLDVANKTIDDNHDQTLGKEDFKGWLKDNKVQAQAAPVCPAPSPTSGPAPSPSPAPTPASAPAPAPEAKEPDQPAPPAAEPESAPAPAPAEEPARQAAPTQQTNTDAMQREFAASQLARKLHPIIADSNEEEFVAIFSALNNQQIADLKVAYPKEFHNLTLEEHCKENFNGSWDNDDFYKVVTSMVQGNRNESNEQPSDVQVRNDIEAMESGSNDTIIRVVTKNSRQHVAAISQMYQYTRNESFRDFLEGRFGGDGELIMNLVP